MDVRAAVVHGPNQPFVMETLQLEGPREGEVLVHIKTTGLCHSDLHVYEGKLPWAFPALLGHEAAGVVVECGPGVTQFKPGDHVIPFLIPHCEKCGYCHSPKTNLCVEAFSRLKPGESRFSLNGKPVTQLWGLGTFADYSVLPVNMLAKVRDDAPFDPICYIGCGATTGLGAALFAAKVEAGSSVVIFGLGGIGLNVVQGARLAGARKIIGVDTNPAKEAIARQFGATDFVNPKAVEKLTSHLMKLTARRRGLHVRMHRQSASHAPGVRMHQSGVGHELCGRRRSAGRGSHVLSGPSDDGPSLDRLLHGRRARHQAARDRRLVRRQEDRSRFTGDAPIEARADQRRLRADAQAAKSIRSVIVL